MSEYRIMGKSVTIRLTRNGVAQLEITAIKSFTFETRQRIITEGYLGESAQRQDEIFDEVGGSLSVHAESTQILTLQKMIADRSRRRVADDEKVGCTFRIQFPDASIARITIPDMKFDPIPFNFSSRDAYVDVGLTYKASEYLLSV